MVSDHLVDQFAPIAALGVAAAVTTRLRLGTFVFNNDLRHPVVLAQEMATLDRLSGGRLELGIGAGWNVPGYESTGIRFDPGEVRIDRLGEAVSILESGLGDGTEGFQGRFYQGKGLGAVPRAMQARHPALLSRRGRGLGINLFFVGEGLRDFAPIVARLRGR